MNQPSLVASGDRKFGFQFQNFTPTTNHHYFGTIYLMLV